jgi:hypothetical protein
LSVRRRHPRVNVGEQGSGVRDQTPRRRRPAAALRDSEVKWLLIGLRYIGEMAAEMVTKHAKGLNLWLRLVETRTLRAAFLGCFGCREFN